MAHITIYQARKDGKYPIRIAYQGAKNMFGGRDHPRVFNKLYTLDKIQELFEGYKRYPGTLVNRSGQPDDLFTQGTPIIPEED
jgi:hypothetical protein